jgi:hypothetical protein
MAIGKASNFVIRDDLFTTIFEEQINQNARNASEQSMGTFQIVTSMIEGDFGKRRFFDRLTGGITRRDTTSVSAATDIPLTMDEVISVKRNFKFGPYAQTLDAFEKAQISVDQMTENLAVIYADELAKETLNSGLIAVTAALSQETSTLVYNYGTLGSSYNLNHTALINGRALLGDAFGRVKAWITHSKSWHDLVAGQLTVGSGNVSDFVVYQGNAGTIGIPVFVTDSSALTVTGTPTQYVTLGLQENAVVVTLSESQRMVGDQITGLENLTYRIQGEGAYNIEVKGYKWDTANGLAAPTDNTLGTSSNWDEVVASHKDKAGVYILTD